MKIFISGSLAYDRIMDFPGHFRDHILPDKIHILNVCFTVNGLSEKFGGTAGNIAYSLALLGERPTILATAGKDFDAYRGWLARHSLPTDGIVDIEEEFTASAYITTDKRDNQITGFNPGAMNRPCGFKGEELDAADCWGIVAPGNLTDMTELPELYRQKGVPYILDPGQSLNIWSGEQLAAAMEGAKVLISNDYELELMARMTGLNQLGMLDLVENIITTKGEYGSVLRTRDDRVEIPIAPAAQVVDPTGAGDSYRSGLLKGLAAGKDLAEACRWGAALSSFAVACLGTQGYAVNEDSFQERLAAVPVR